MFISSFGKWKLVVGAMMLTIAAPAVAQMPEAAPARVIAVVGEGTSSEKAETVSLSLSISSQDASASAVFAKHNIAINHLIQALQDAGIPSTDISEGNLSMNPTYDYSQAGQSPRLVGYHLMTPIMVRIQDMTSLPRLLDVATQSGASNVSIGGFGTKKKDYLRDEATKDALKDAHERAEELAKLIGASLGDIVSISDMEAEAPGRAEMEREGMPGHALEKHVELKVVYGLR